MKENHLHIISFDVPFPADYGGVIDVYYKIKSLYNKGVKIHLHIFQYGRDKAPYLELFCEEVNYYPRKTGIINNFSTTPYIILSRMSSKLIDKLSRDNYPILCEGMHTCGVILSPSLKGRKFIYRSSNVEHHYYNGLADTEPNILKKIFYRTEAKKLQQWEKNLALSNLFLSVSKAEQKYYSNHFPNNRIENIYSFFDQENIISTHINNNDKYILFHANLSVGENITTANLIINEIAPYIEHRIIIAGMNPNSSIYTNSKKQNNIELIANPDNNRMKILIRDAHINLLLTNQATGLKLKLLNSLYQGRFCLVNNNMLIGTGLNNFVEIADKNEDIINKINLLMQQDFSEEIFNNRLKKLPKEFNNNNKADRLIELIFNH